MGRAVRAGNVTQAEQILIGTGTRRAHPVPAEDRRRAANAVSSEEAVEASALLR
ncbi:hypothetical protein ACIP4W_06690 [Streptomyces sp. NPDC088846]|uniref:hypothetical protein n=1 Tax=Streptomyces sp. NPDC088846 TaxID=3365908 RepID=UPI0038079617